MLVTVVLATVGAPKAARRNRDRIVAVLEDQGAYNSDGIRDLLTSRFDGTMVLAMEEWTRVCTVGVVQSLWLAAQGRYHKLVILPLTLRRHPPPS